MSEQHDGGPAFPNGSGHGYEAGMTLRDYFAGQALAGYVSAYTAEEILDAEIIAGHAYEIADAMLNARAEAAQQKGKGDE